MNIKQFGVLAISMLTAFQCAACPKLDKTKTSNGLKLIVKFDDMTYKTLIRAQQKNEDEAVISFVYTSPRDQGQEFRGTAEAVCVDGHWAIEKIIRANPNYSLKYTIPARIY